MDLPIQLHSHKEYDEGSYVDLDDLYVRNIMLRGTKVFGSGDENMKGTSSRASVRTLYSHRHDNIRFLVMEMWKKQIFM